MIDWSKYGASNNPTAATPDTTAPVAPAAPGSLAGPGLAPTVAPVTGPRVDLNPTAAQGTGYVPGNSGQAWSATQADVDALDPGQKMARGIDILGNALFGQGNGSLLGGVPLLGDIVGAGGNAIHAVGTVPEKIGIEAPLHVLSHIPTGWLTGGDSTFDSIGTKLAAAKDSDPFYAKAYDEWLKVAAVANKDVLGGGNMKADFNTEFLKSQDDRQYDSALGPAQGFAIGAAGTGSLGGMLSHAIDNFLGLGGAVVQDTLGSKTAAFDPYYSGIKPQDVKPGNVGSIQYLLDAAAHPGKYVTAPGASTSLDINTMNDFERYAVQNVQSGKWDEAQAQEWMNANINTKLNRVAEAKARLDTGMEVSPVEKMAVEAWQGGAWSEQHALDYITAHGQGITRNPIGQALGSVVTDPLTYATLGAGEISKIGTVGKAILDVGKPVSELSNFEKLAVGVARVQQGQMGPAFRIARGLIDPMGVYKPSTVARATTDLVNGAALDGLERAMGPNTVKDFRADMREVGMGVEGDTHMASYAMDKGHEMIAGEKQLSLLQEGFGEAMLAGEIPLDETITLASQNAARDAGTKVADYIQRISKVTFTAEDLRTLPARLASVYGKDIEFWQGKLTKASDDLRSMYHAMSFKGGEKDFTQSVAKVDRVAYEAAEGKLPIDRMTLMNSETMDDVVAQQVSDQVKNVLAKAAEDPEAIDNATRMWNDLAHRYPTLETKIGLAPGGAEQLDGLLKQLDRAIEDGGFIKRAQPDELAHPALQPVRDFLDRHTMPMNEEEVIAARAEAASRAELAAQTTLRVRKQRKALETVLADTQTATGRAKPGMKGARDAAKEALDNFNAKHAAEAVPDAVPGTLYHGSPATNLKAASANPATRQYDNATSVFGAFVTPSRGEAARYAGAEGRVYEAAAESLPKNPYEMTRKEFTYFQSPEKGADGVTNLANMEARTAELKAEAEKLKADLIAQGYDGVHVPGSGKGAVEEFASFGDVNLRAEGTAFAEANIGDKPLWRVGFRPDESVAWGVRRDPVTGAVMYDRAPTISHVIDAVPGRQKFSDTTRNVLGQIIGTSKAERLNKPIDSMEAFINTITDGITGQRLVTNIEQRFERSTFDAGIPKSVSKEIMARAKDVAGLHSTTLRGVQPGNIWDAIHEIIPGDLVLKDGTTLNQHIVMDHLLKAAEGDLRIMGLTSVTSQRLRNAMRAAHLDPANWTGQMTVTMYNKLRYSQPMFLIQRITDAPYYSILYGIKPVGKGVLTGLQKETQDLLDAIGRTGLARHFSMDMPEYATRSNFTAGIKSIMQQKGLTENVLDRVHNAPDAIIANNMTNMMHARWGDIVKGSLDNLMTAAEKADPSIRAEMMAQAEELGNTFGELRRIYSEAAGGRILDDNEVGLRYVQDMLNAGRRQKVLADGTIDLKALREEGERWLPGDIGRIDSIRPDSLAQEIGAGFADARALRQEVAGVARKGPNGEFQLVKGTKDLKWLDSKLRQLGVSNEYRTRAMAYFGGDWDSFWYDLSRPVEKGGLDISAHYAKEAQAVVAAAAKERGMDPWEYLSGVMATNIGARSINDEMAKLVRFLQAGRGEQPLEAWSDLFRAHLDTSAQKTLIAHFENSAEGAAKNEELLAKSLKPAEWGQKTVKSRPGRPDRTVGALPANFTVEPGYGYRIDTIDRMRGGLKANGEGVSIGAPDTTYIDGRPGQGVFRVQGKMGAEFSPYSAVAGAPAVPGYGAAANDVAPEAIEMLTPDGWVSLGEDPMNKIMAQDFPDLLRKRAVSGVPHPDPEVEGYMQAFSKWLKTAIPDEELATRTRGDLRSIVEGIPTQHATNFNRTHDLIVTLLKDKIDDASQDVFRLAEMQTKRTVIERSLNHPLFGLYPSSYMWGKVLPETIKFLAKNPYAATYVIADVQRAIATQREYDPQVEHLMKSMDRSAGMFLMDYLTPGLPWNDHEARLSPLVKDILNGKPQNIWPDELNTVSPDRWIKQIRQTMGEVPGALDALQGAQAPTDPAVAALAGISGSGGPTGPATPTGTPGHPSQITGTVPAAGLAGVLSDDLSRLQSILLSGADAGQ